MGHRMQAGTSNQSPKMATRRPTAKRTTTRTRRRSSELWWRAAWIILATATTAAAFPPVPNRPASATAAFVAGTRPTSRSTGNGPPQLVPPRTRTPPRESHPGWQRPHSEPRKPPDRPPCLLRSYRSDAHETTVSKATERLPPNPPGLAEKRLLGAALLAATIGLSAAFPLPAHAGFGPSSGATTTPPPNLNSISANARKVTSPEKAPTESFNVDLDGKKLKILIDSALDSRRLEEFSGQLDAVIDSLKESISESLAAAIQASEEDGTGAGLPEGAARDSDNAFSSAPSEEQRRARNAERERELLQAQVLREEVLKQEQIIARLQRQPYWFNYFAAFVGSTVSTLIMHPIDTIKTRLQVGLGEDEADDNDEHEHESCGPLPPDRHDNLSRQNSGAEPLGAASQSLQASRSNGRASSDANAATDTNASNGEDHCSVTEKGRSAFSSDTGLVAAPTVLVADADAANQTETFECDGTDPMHTNHGGRPYVTKPPLTSGNPLLFENLYEGLTGNLFKEVPPSAVYLGVYETVKYALTPMVTNPAYLLWVYLVAGSAGEVVGSIIRAPAEAVKSLVQSKAHNSTLDAARSVLLDPSGRQNVVRAWSASISRDVPFGGIQLAVFETIKAAILNNPNIEIDSSTLLAEAIIGAVAGGIGALVTAPADVITTRIITQDTGDGTVVTTADGATNANTNGTAPMGVLEMGKTIYEEEGIGAFFVGWQARVGYWAPAIGIFLSCYCSVRQAGLTYDLFP